MQQAARVLEHDPRLLALVHELRNELAHALVAPVEDRRIVVVANAGVVHHRLEIADHTRGAKIVAAGRDHRLVHVQRIGETAFNRAEVDPAAP